jgi:aminoglycoside phosphotransferase (APT) family kinase protein
MESMMATHSFRPGLEFEVSRLEAWLATHITDFRGPITVRQFPGGQSNPTYLLQGEGVSFVLRRKPPGALLQSAHAVEREYRVMLALGTHTDVPVARTMALCEDPTVIGTPFYLMEHVVGRIFWNPMLPDLPVHERAAIFGGMNHAIARLHSADPMAIGLADFGRTGGYVSRQIARWSKQYAGDEASAGRVPAIEKLIDWLPRHLPALEPAASVVHGDYRIDNLVFHPNEPRVLAILDWELSTLGDPFADFAYHLMMYRMDSASIPGLAGRSVATLGLPSERDYVAAYCVNRGISCIPHLDFYMAFSMFKLATIFHGIRGRVQRGTAVSAQARMYASEVESIADLAWRQAAAPGAGTP